MKGRKARKIAPESPPDSDTESAASTDTTSNTLIAQKGLVFWTNLLGGEEGINIGFPYHNHRFQGKGASDMLHFLLHKHLKIVSHIQEPLPWRNDPTLRSIWLPKHGISQGLKDRDGLVGEKTLNAGFQNGLLTQSLRMLPNNDPQIVRYKVRGSDRAVHDFREAENHYSRQKYAYQHLKSSCVMTSTWGELGEFVPLTFMNLAFDFFNGKEIRNHDDYESSSHILPQGEILPDGRYIFPSKEGFPYSFVFNHRSDWIEGLKALQLEVLSDATLSLFLTDVMMNYEMEVALEYEPHQWYGMTVSKQRGQIRSAQKEYNERITVAKAAEEKELTEQKAAQHSSFDSSAMDFSEIEPQRVATKGHRTKKKSYSKKKASLVAYQSNTVSDTVSDSEHDHGQSNKLMAHAKASSAADTTAPDDSRDGWSTFSNKKARKSIGQIPKAENNVLQRVTLYPAATSSTPPPKKPHQIPNQRSGKPALKVTQTKNEATPGKLEDFPPLPQSAKPSASWVKEAVSPTQTTPEKPKDSHRLPYATKHPTPPVKEVVSLHQQTPAKLEDSSPLPKSPPSPPLISRDNHGLERSEDSTPLASAVVPYNQIPEQPEDSPQLAAPIQSPVHTAIAASCPSTRHSSVSSKTALSDNIHALVHAKIAADEPKPQIDLLFCGESAAVPGTICDIPVAAGSFYGDSEPDVLDAGVQLSSSSTASSSAASSVIHVKDAKPTRFVRHDFANVAAEASSLFGEDPKFKVTATQGALPEPRIPYSYPCTSCRLRQTPTIANPVTLCPGCGPLCNIKYCSTECLLADALHHSGECMRWSPSEDVVHPVVPRLDDPFRLYPESFIPYYAGNHKIPESPELFRQKAFSQWRFPGDYFVFNPVPAGRDVLYTLSFARGTVYKVQFRRALNASFLVYDDAIMRFLFRATLTPLKSQELAANRSHDYELWDYFDRVIGECTFQFEQEFGFPAGQERVKMGQEQFAWDQEWSLIESILRDLELANPVLGYWLRV